MQKILPINTEINVTCFQFEAFPLAIISNYKESFPWIHSNYIQLAFHKDFIEAPVPFKFYLFDYSIIPWLKVQKLDREVYPLFNEDIVDFIKKAIDLEYYVYLNVDEYFIPHRTAFKNYNKSHDILVLGYSENDLEFSVLGYNDKQFFSKTKVPYDLFRKGFQNLSNIENDCNQIYLYKFERNANYTFRLSVVIDSLKEYLYSMNSAGKFNALAEPENLVFGIECYNYLDKYLDYLGEGAFYIDLRYLQKLLEHKSCMLKRIEYLEQEDYLEKKHGFSNTYSDVVKKSKNIKLLTMKFNKKNNVSTFKNIKKILKDIKDLEIETLSKLIKRLEYKQNLDN
ncbi:hypothetical protein ABE083_06560 [Bacillus mycoides]|uniref:Butirosin biosynthesis protein H N-terminal domain-containing protein n=1 Tax=Bacillus mycoides TaxID=1405 RepID=A0A1S9T111_BACMY|nr:hypothetical protein [Bacillus mycoides]OOR03657.1 hypothetical protein BW900_25835 [Bacillus mycoides]